MMTRYRQAFPMRHALLPVIHSESLDQTLRNAEVAYVAGCPGVFLINHGMHYRDLLMIHQAVCRRFPKWWVGVKCLDLSPTEVFQRVNQEVSGIWVDNAQIDEHTRKQPLAEMIQDARRRSGWQGLYFGGVAFKYQRGVEDLATAAQVATQYMDVVRTSGTGTGRAFLGRHHEERVVNFLGRCLGNLLTKAIGFFQVGGHRTGLCSAHLVEARLQSHNNWEKLSIFATLAARSRSLTTRLPQKERSSL